MNVVKRTLTRSAGIRTWVRPIQRHNAETFGLVSSSYLSNGFATTSAGASASTLDSLAETLKSSKDLATIHRCCSALTAELRDSKVAPPTQISPEDRRRLLFILHLLAVSGRPEDVRRTEEILHDLYPVLGMEPTRAVYTSILRGLLDHHHDEQAQSLLLKMPQLPGHFTPTLDQLHMVMETCSNGLSTFAFVRELFMNMRRMGQRPTNETFGILLRASWKVASRDNTIPKIEELSSLIQESARQGLPFNPGVADILYKSYAEIGQLDQAREILAFYELTASSVDELAYVENVRPPQVDVDSSSSSEVSKTSDKSRSYLHNSRSSADIQHAEERFGIKCTVVHWSIVINNCLRAGQISGAIEVYEQSKRAGITPDAGMVAPLLKALSRVDSRGNSEESIQKAMSLYRDLADAVPASKQLSSEKSKTLNDHSQGPDQDIYDTLLRLLLSSRNPTQYLRVADSILKEMTDRGISTDSSPIVTSRIIIQMRKATSFAEAHDFYRQHRSKLNEYGYGAVLQEYCRLSFRDNLQTPLITQYFGIVNDMRLQRVPITPKVYTIILHQIGLMATRVRREDPHSPSTRQIVQRLIATIRRAHDFLTLDASISPDATLWNQLMNTYQRLGCFGDSYRVWEMMYLTGRYNQISVSIILDACAYAGKLQTAHFIRSKLAKAGFEFDLRNWNTWIECLCRLGRLDDAFSVICFEMRESGMEPDVDSVRILSKFAKREGCWKELLPRLQGFMPDLWNRLPDEIRNS
ncbi:hypothetical protein B0H34DRAFT_740448 [Crassisporium funariophilum]|nr:hypothetical protein B0H34DRAFT_740448 [Crassisporium funariophilum]